MSFWKRFTFLSVVFVLSLTVPFIAFAAPEVIFYDADGTTELERIPTVEASAGKFYIHWKELNKVPDYTQDGGTVILTWKKHGDTTGARYVLSSNAAYQAASSQSNPNPAPVLRDNLVYLTEELKLVPLKTTTLQEFRDIRDNSIVVDGHTDAPMRIVDGTTWRPVVANDLSNEEGRVVPSQALYPWLKSGGLSGALHAAYTGGYPNEDFTRGSGDRANSRILALLNATHWSAERNPTWIQLVTDSARFKAAFGVNKIGIMQSIEGAYSITEANYEELLEQYYDLGVRVISFTWNSNSYLAAGNLKKDPDVGTGDSAVIGKSWSGMSELGKKVLLKMDELGIVYDVSHSDDDTVNDALAITKNPIIASHSGARAVFDNVRNLWDPEIVAIAKNGGMIFQNLYGDFIADPRSVYEMADHVDHIVALLEKPVAEGGAGFAKGTGVEYIGIGTDYDGGTNVADANDARYFYRITKELLARGYTKEAIKKIFGENAFRVMDKVQANAAAGDRGGSAVINAPTASGNNLVKGINYTVNTRTPEFRATVSGASSGKIIVDGIVYPAALNGTTLTYSLTTPLQESFHVVTFEAADSSGKVTRDTKIFYVGDTAPIHKVEFMNPDRTTVISVVYVNDNTAIDPSGIPASANGKAITGWKLYGTDEVFDISAKLARSYRLVASTEAGNSGSSGGGCSTVSLTGAVLLLSAYWFIRRKK